MTAPDVVEFDDTPDADYTDDDTPTYRPPLTLQHARAVLEGDGADAADYVQAIASLSIASSLERLVELLEQRHAAADPFGTRDAERRPLGMGEPDDAVIIRCSGGRPDAGPMRRSDAELVLAHGNGCPGQHVILRAP